MWYNLKAVAARAGKRDRSLKIEQQERSTKHIKKYVRTNSKFFKENTTQTKVKEAKKKSSDKKDTDCALECRKIYKTFESLILAQDERWRRA